MPNIALNDVPIGKDDTFNKEILKSGSLTKFNFKPIEFKLMVNRIRDIEDALGSMSLEITEIMKKSRNFSRSLFFVMDIHVMTNGSIFHFPYIHFDSNSLQATLI